MSERPWFKFYPTNWRADPKLRMCSLAARGLWIEMLCVMHEATPRGSLKVGDKALSARNLGSLVGVGEQEASDLLAELEAADVFSRGEDGVIFSRRMRREVEVSAKAREWGKGGGNPSLTGRVKGGVKGPSKDEDKEPRNPYMAVASSISDTPTDQEEASPRAKEIDRLESELREAAGLTNSISTGLFDLSPMIRLIDQGYSLVNDILPKLRAAAAAGKTPSTWAYYVPAITDGKAKNDAIPAKANGTPSTDVVWLDEDDPRWGKVAGSYREKTGKALIPTTSRYSPGFGAYVTKADYPELSPPTGA